MKIAKALSYFIVVLLIVLVIGGLFAFINNGQSNFYVQYGGRQISAKASEICLPKDFYSVFYVKNIFDMNVSDMSADDYTVEIVATDNMPNIDVDVDGVKDDLRSLDFTPAFNVVKKDGYFTLFLLNEEKFTLQNVLERLYPDKQVSVSTGINIGELDCFCLRITSLAEEKTITVSFH